MNQVPLNEQTATHEQFLRDVCCGLQKRNKSLPTKYFYDQRGSELFERICQLDEYYLSRTELVIMRGHVVEMADCVGSGCKLVEFGSGSSLKTELLLDHIDKLSAYVPIDIARNVLELSARRLVLRYPELVIQPICADFTLPFSLPDLGLDSKKTVGYFPGSTIGNFSPDDEIKFLRRVAELVGPGGGLLIGVDLKKDREILECAYNDSLSVTKQFNLNLLARINHELGANFSLDNFKHHAFYNATAGRIEMHLISLADQSVKFGESVVEFTKGESIHTESSYKYDPDHFHEIASATGFDLQQRWTDERRFFSVQYLVAR